MFAMLAEAAPEHSQSYVEAYIIPGWVVLLALLAVLIALLSLLIRLGRRSRGADSRG